MLRPPPSLLRLFELSAEPDLDPKRLKKMLADVNGLTEQIMQYAAVFYKKRRAAVGNIDRVIQMVGVRNVYDLATQYALVQSMSQSDLPDVVLASCWSDCVHRALAARKLAKHVYGVHPDFAFTVGLALEFGALVLLDREGRVVPWMCDIRPASGPRRRKLEQELFGKDHIEAFAIVAREWEIPSRVSAAIEEHNPEARGRERGDHGTLEQILYWAERLGESITAGASGPELDRWVAGITRVMGMKPDKAWRLIGQVLEESIATAQAIGVSVGEQPSLLSLQERAVAADTASMSVDEMREYAETMVERNQVLQNKVEQVTMEMAAVQRRDALTELPNHRGCLQRLDGQVEAVQRDGGDVSLVIADIDGIGEINIRYGHERGDEVIKAVADAMRKIVRGNDQLARVGPDSFAVIVKGDGKAGRLVGERLRAGVEKVRVKIGKSHMRVTITVSGLSLSDLEDGAGADAMLAAAHRLLQPKRRGRGNRTEWHQQVEMRRRA